MYLDNHYLEDSAWPVLIAKRKKIRMDVPVWHD